MFEAILPSLISGGANLLGGMIGASGQGATNAQQMAMFQQSMAFNAAEAQKNRDWQQMMGSTAYQRAMQDMRVAGLNPILAAGGVTPGGGGGSAGSIGGGPQLGNPGASMGAGVASAGQAARQAVELDAVQKVAERDESQTSLNKATEAATKENEALTKELNQKARQDTATSAAQMHSVNETAANTKADTINKAINAVILSHDANTAFQKSRLAKAQADQQENYGPGTIGELGGTIEKGIGRVLDQFRSGGGGSLTSPTDPRWWGFRGRPQPAGKPGPGLVIDITK